MKKFLTRRLTAGQAVVVIVLALILAGLGYLGYNLVSAAILEARVKAALPQVCSAIRNQRKVLLSAIEAYKSHFGVYPPDHLLSRQPLVVDAVTNTLLYELAGVVYNPTNKAYRLDRMEEADADFVKRFFGCDFKNCSTNPAAVQNFLGEFPPFRQVHDDPDTYLLSFALYSEPVEPELLYQMDSSPWRYVSSAPTNNPGRFDLWMEVWTKTRKVTIGNWKEVE
ncbi:MAG TPA: hypothetical protein VG146_17645 [Verrucomicrobiae bacterium]|nr:hypothetical protein [Verrucomicrobiae bacterium]